MKPCNSSWLLCHFDPLQIQARPPWFKLHLTLPCRNLGSFLFRSLVHGPLHYVRYLPFWWALMVRCVGGCYSVTFSLIHSTGLVGESKYKHCEDKCLKNTEFRLLLTTPPTNDEHHRDDRCAKSRNQQTRAPDNHNYTRGCRLFDPLVLVVVVDAPSWIC